MDTSHRRCEPRLPMAGFTFKFASGSNVKRPVLTKATLATIVHEAIMASQSAMGFNHCAGSRHAGFIKLLPPDRRSHPCRMALRTVCPPGPCGTVALRACGPAGLRHNAGLHRQLSPSNLQPSFAQTALCPAFQCARCQSMLQYKTPLHRAHRDRDVAVSDAATPQWAQV